jgi:uncharacterized membrane protein
MTILAISIAGYALAVMVLPQFGPPLTAILRAEAPIALHVHLIGGLTALAVGPWQLNTRLRNRVLNVHRWMGRTYVVAVLVGGLGALALAVRSKGGLVTHVGFGILGALWLVSTFQAWRHIRAKNQELHRQWMIRSYSLTLAAVMLRIWMPLSQVAGIPIPEAYQVVSWLCWVPNLVVAEWVILRRGTEDMLA